MKIIIYKVEVDHYLLITLNNKKFTQKLRNEK